MSYDHKTTLATIEVLADLYPACFSVLQHRRKPLKVGIYEDLIAALNGAISPKEAGLALAVYCGNHGYLRACTNVGAARVDLYGNQAGVVDTAAAANARRRLEQQRDRWKRRQEAKAQAKAAAEVKAKSAGRITLADLRKAAEQRRQSTLYAEKIAHHRATQDRLRPQRQAAMVARMAARKRPWRSA